MLEDLRGSKLLGAVTLLGRQSQTGPGNLYIITVAVPQGIPAPREFRK